MKAPTTRRHTLKILSSSVAASTLLKQVRAQDNNQDDSPHQANQRTLKIIVFGLGSRGKRDIEDFVSHENVELLAACDPDTTTHEGLDVPCYQTAEELIEHHIEEADIGVVSTPDHAHASLSAACLNAGLHCYSQKPLTRTVAEARQIAQLSQEKPELFTQTGTQLASADVNLRFIDYFRSGHLGKAIKAYAWSYKTWGDDGELPDRQDPVPDHLDWDSYLNVTQKIPFIEGAYHPNEWRKRVHFGTGTLGDMGAHIIHPVLAALQLGLPNKIKSLSDSQSSAENWALINHIKYSFASNDRCLGDEFDIEWYSGNMDIPRSIRDNIPQRRLPNQGLAIICENGAIVGSHGSLPEVIGLNHEDFNRPENTEFTSHHHHFVNAILGRDATIHAPFNWGAYVAEVLALGAIVSFYPNQELHYDSEEMRFTNFPEANPHLTRGYRENPAFPVPQRQTD